METKTFKAWHLCPERDSIKVVRLLKNKSIIEQAKSLLNCKYVEYYGFSSINGKKYGILMNDLCLYQNEPFNKCATKLLLKTPLNFGVKKLTGWYLIYSYIDNEDEELNISLYHDMDLTPKEFIKESHNAVKK